MNPTEMLKKAVEDGDLDTARMAIQAGADVNHPPEPYDDSILENAITFTENPTLRFLLVRLLLEAGADPNPPPIGECGPLFAAHLWMDTEVFQLLLDHGADPNFLFTDTGESLYDYVEFGYRFNVWGLEIGTEATEAEKANEEAWLAFMDRRALEDGLRRPDCLMLLRERGARTTKELRDRKP